MLRVMFLNTWGGELWEDLQAYIRAVRSEFDVLCFSEVHDIPHIKGKYITPTLSGSRKKDIFASQWYALCKLLPKHTGYYTAHGEYLLHDLERHKLPVRYGIAMFVSKDIPTFFNSGMVFGQYNKTNEGSPAGRAIQGITFKKGNAVYVVSHFHGIWINGHKDDTIERQRQSINADVFMTEMILKARSVFCTKPKMILGGDLNLTSKSTSLKFLQTGNAFDGEGRILNHEFGITDTRTSHYSKGVREADFVLASPNVKVTSFLAPTEFEVSDHKPLILECE